MTTLRAKTALRRAGATIFLSSLAAFAQADDFPSHAVQIIVPFSAAGPLDLLARNLAQTLQADLKQPFIVTNQTGATGNIGAKNVAQAKPDGYTLLLTLHTVLTANPTLYGSNMGFSPSDLRPITTLVNTAQMLVVNPSLHVKTFAEFVDRARKQGLTYASAGNASPGHLAMEQLAGLIDAHLTHVPYRGNAPAVTDLLGGQVQAGFLVAPGVMPYVRSGKLVALAISGSQRSPLAPDIPTVAEAGFPGATIEFGMVVLAPAATPDVTVATLNAAFRKALASPALQPFLKESDMIPIGDTPDEAAARLKKTTVQMAHLITTRGIRAD